MQHRVLKTVPSAKKFFWLCLVSPAIPCTAERTLGALIGLEKYLRLTMTLAQVNHSATYHSHHDYLTKIPEERFSKLFVKEQMFWL